MKILSLNVWGLGVKGKFGWVIKICSTIRGNWVLSGQESLIVNVYGPHKDSSKIRLWNSLDNIISRVDSAWVLCGDFNEVRERSDRLNYVFMQNRASRFNEFIARNNLIEIPITGRKFTRISDDGVKFSKLDRFLVNDSFIGLWKDLSVHPLDRRVSDHCPLILRDKYIDYGPKPFKIFNEWFNYDGIDETVNKALSKPVKSRRLDCTFRDKLKNVKFDLRDWSKRVFGNLDCESVESRISERPFTTVCAGDTTDPTASGVPTGPDSNRPTTIPVEIGHFNSSGPVNRPGSVPVLVRRSVRATGPASNHATNHAGPRLLHLSETEANELELPFGEKEIWDAINDCGGTKSPGPDGFNLSF
ncbi:uncharacterized protein [Rutidosis leptorrhynchoides]|uniref:uncharacterized protein n=1 Tax=Rutidosis leptorrhynchoides TaxID=125765 RepID=UPI003A99C85C